MRPLIRFALVASLVLSSAPLHAEEVRTEAAERFDRALRRVNAGDLSGGLAEFQRAYTLVPSPVVIYNIGLVEAALNRPVEAARALEKALASADTLRPDYVERARVVLAEQRDRIGQVVVTSNVKEGTVELDNVEIGKLPLTGPVDVGSGAHVIGVVSPGYAPARKPLLVASHARVEAHLELVAIEGRLAHVAVSSRVPAAEVLVDDELVGKTPLEATITVTPGTHRVRVRRAGYVPVERAITLQDGATSNLSVEPTVDRAALVREGGFLAIHVTEDQAVLSVDGESAGLVSGPIELPAGPHRIRVERGGFLPADRDVVVPLGDTKSLSVILEPTPDTRARYVTAAKSRRLWSWVTVGAGAAIAGAGTAFALVQQSQLSSAQDSLAAANALWVRGSGKQCDFTRQLSNQQIANCQSLLNDASGKVSDDKTMVTVGWISAGVGVAAMAAGLALVLTGDDPSRYDQPAPTKSFGIGQLSVSPAAGGGAITLGGWF